MVCSCGCNLGDHTVTREARTSKSDSGFVVSVIAVTGSAKSQVFTAPLAESRRCTRKRLMSVQYRALCSGCQTAPSPQMSPAGTTQRISSGILIPSCTKQQHALDQPLLPVERPNKFGVSILNDDSQRAQFLHSFPNTPPQNLHRLKPSRQLHALGLQGRQEIFCALPSLRSSLHARRWLAFLPRHSISSESPSERPPHTGSCRLHLRTD